MPRRGALCLDWRTLAATFALVFVAELGDKTQLATMLLAAESKSLAAVFLGAAGALALSALIGVAAGDLISRVVPMKYLQISAGIAFIVIGFLLLRGRI